MQPCLLHQLPPVLHPAVLGIEALREDNDRGACLGGHGVGMGSLYEVKFQMPKGLRGTRISRSSSHKSCGKQCNVVLGTAPSAWGQCRLPLGGSSSRHASRWHVRKAHERGLDDFWGLQDEGPHWVPPGPNPQNAPDRAASKSEVRVGRWGLLQRGWG